MYDKTCSGSIIFPFTAERATVSGDARYIFAPWAPIRPGLLLMVVVMAISLSHRTPKCFPGQGPHPGGIMIAPAFLKQDDISSLSIDSMTFLEPGVMIKVTLGSTLSFPRISAITFIILSAYLVI